MRTFIGIDILGSNEIIHQFQHNLVNNFNLDQFYVKPIKKNNLHLTLKFLGEKNESEIKEIISNLKNFSFLSFDITFNKIGFFPKPSVPRIIWIGPDPQSISYLRKIFGEINSILNKKSYTQNNNNNNKKNSNLVLSSDDFQQFNPHLTIFRISGSYKIPSSFIHYSDKIYIKEQISRISLKQSILTSDGPIYSDLYTINANKRNE